jgi:hypothetical protein
MPIRPELRHTAHEAMAEDYLDVASRRSGADPHGRAPPVRGVSSVSGILPSGRVVRLYSREAPVPLGDLDQLVGTLRRMGEDADAAILARSQAIARLSRTVASDADQMIRRQLATRRKREARLLAGSAVRDRRIDKELVALREDIEKVASHHERLLRHVGRRALWDDLVVLSALPLFAAFGQRGSPFSSSNLVLALSLFVWLLGDELTDLISGAGTVFGIRDTDIWSYIAPAANVLTGLLLLRDSQAERFITGFARDFQPSFRFGGALPSASADLQPHGGYSDGAPERRFTFRQELDLLPLIAPDHRSSFEIFENVPAVASIAQIKWAPGLEDPADRRVVGLAAVVEDGILIITVTVAVTFKKQLPRQGAVLSALVAAWIVDTTEPKACPWQHALKR